MALDLSVAYATRSRAVPTAGSIRRWARAAWSVRRRAELAVRIVDRAEARRLNARWRGRDAPTNVLSFPPGVAAAEHACLGDIVLCAPVVNEQARAQGKPRSAHWAHMVIHGVLHLLGYDHMVLRDARRMEALERRLLARFGYPDPY